METTWYYSESGEQSRGPVSIEALGQILAASRSPENLLVWSPGMSDWARAANVDSLGQYFRQNLSPPIASGDATATAPDATASNLHPWRRYFARMIDIYLFVLVFFFFLGVVFPEWFDPDVTPGAARVNELVYTIVGLAAYVIFEAFCLNVFGSTPGKLLYGIRLVPKAGQQISFPVALKRSLAVWIRGLGLGIPLVSLVTLIVAYNMLKQEGQTRWDRNSNILVQHRDLSIFRWLAIILAWLLVLSIMALAVAASKS